MGSLCTAGAGTAADQKVAKDIEKNLIRVEKVDKKENKLLLLGTGSSGKSTLFKGLRLVNGSTFDTKEQIDTRHVIRSNIVAAIMTLLQKSQMLYEKDPEQFGDCQVNINDQNIVKAIQVVVSFADESFNDDANMPPTRLEALGNSVSSLWLLPALQQTYENRQNRFSFLDNMEHYFGKVQEIMKLDYIPSDEDVLKSRIRTTGVIEMIYEKDDNIFKICDVGGQRSERKKWIHSFEHVAAVIFVTALNHYSCVLFEDETRNAMHEAMELFDDICNSKWFRKSGNCNFLFFFMYAHPLHFACGLLHVFICIWRNAMYCLNRDDIAGWEGDQWNSTLDYVTKPNVQYTDDPDFLPCYQAALEFILDQFLKINKDPEKTVYHHVTCATDSNSVEYVFWDVQNFVIRANLKRGGLMV
ncbi:guanine nucleotide-binding protein subunit alpha [Reticulomyxa filosa]|uniref:Guanine nucleotide-binding protein subunit alpha n=1 Tax=Reticulomyxa filosa TaxID=46433 RepID=X6PCX2_RETFI|nr:guanine nucleotide-binding protein subunit alpha [Reticulomyxa filosa]|eukprot:ETO35522.1 guanine nucleotide-binding protein subunit alpha [Reticulomyxa filosa]